MVDFQVEKWMNKMTKIFKNLMADKQWSLPFINSENQVKARGNNETF